MSGIINFGEGIFILKPKEHNKVVARNSIVWVRPVWLKKCISRVKYLFKIESVKALYKLNDTSDNKQ